MSIKAVIFDLDGVIVSTDSYHFRAWEKLADEENIFFDEVINRQLRGVSRMESLEIVLERSKTVYSREKKQLLAERKNRYYKEMIQELTPDDILDGVSEFLAELKKENIKIAIGSSSKNSPLILSKIGLDRYFDATVDGNDIKNSKPDPEVFITAAKRLKIEPEYCVVIEDAEAGIEAAIAAGMKVIGVGSASDSTKATLTAENFSKLSIKDIMRI
jgi:beta-phosphoglucomutase